MKGLFMKTLALLLSLILLAHPALAQTESPPPEPNSIVVPCIVGGCVLVGGAYVVWELWQLCKKVGLTNSVPPPPPSTAPPSKGCTNGVPSKKDMTQAPVSLSLGTNRGQAYDVSGFVFDNKDPLGEDWKLLVTDCVLTSTNLIDWEPAYYLTAWISPHYVLTVWSDKTGPVSTNCDLATSAIEFEMSPMPQSRSRFFK